MRAFVCAVLVTAVLALCTPSVALAGMPSVNLTDLARMRVQTLSFFLASLLVSAWFVKLLWNYLQRDFLALPRLSYGKALGVVVLWGLLFVLVLTMISGARELMTPGAWERQGLTYRLARTADTPLADTPEERERRRTLERRREALWSYAQSHDGRFPAQDFATEIPAELWLTPESPRLRYLYVAGQHADRDANPLVYEPGIYGERRLVLLTNGTIKAMVLDEVLQALPPEKP